jgi:citrate synthase
MLGIPDELFTALFAIARVAGWCSHRNEEIATGSRIIRPAYKSIVPHKLYIPMEDRDDLEHPHHVSGLSHLF